jgi:hypothetical protein
MLNVKKFGHNYKDGNPPTHLAVFHKGIYYAGIKIFNNLPVAIKELSHDIKQFKLDLGSLLYFHSFYMLDEYFKHKTN